MNGLSLVFLQQLLFEPAVAYSALLIFFKQNFIVSPFAVVNWKRGGTEKKIMQVQNSINMSNCFWGVKCTFGVET